MSFQIQTVAQALNISPVLTVSGTPLDPALKFSTDNNSDTGLFLSSENVIGVSTGGSINTLFKDDRLQIFIPLMLEEISGINLTSIKTSLSGTSAGILYKKTSNNSLYWYTDNGGEFSLTGSNFSLTPNRLVSSNGLGALSSTTLSNWITGSSNQINVLDVGDGKTNLSLPQSIATNSTPTFASVVFTALSAGSMVSLDADKRLRTTSINEWIFGTPNQITVSTTNNLMTLSLPQSIATNSTPTFASVVLTSTLDVAGIITASNLTVNRIIATNSSKQLVSVSLLSYVSGTTNRILVSDNGSGGITLTTPQPLDTGASVTFSNITVSGINVSRIVQTNGSGALSSSDLTNFISGTTDRITVTSNGSGGVILNISPNFSGGSGSGPVMIGSSNYRLTSDAITLLTNAATTPTNNIALGVSALNAITNTSAAYFNVAIGNVIIPIYATPYNTITIGHNILANMTSGITDKVHDAIIIGKDIGFNIASQGIINTVILGTNIQNYGTPGMDSSVLIGTNIAKQSTSGISGSVIIGDNAITDCVSNNANGVVIIGNYASTLTPHPIAIGSAAGSYSTGSNNLFIGRNVGSSGNGSERCIVGNEAGYQSVGSYTTAIGNYVLYNGCTGQFNIIIGYNACFPAGCGTKNIVIGSNGRVSSNSIINSIVLGHDLTSKGSNTTLIGTNSHILTRINGTGLCIGADANSTQTTLFQSSSATNITTTCHNSSAAQTADTLRLTTGTTKGADFSFIKALDSSNDTVYNLRGDGTAFCDGTWTGGGADYAELFESESGQALTVGYTVVLSNGKIKEYTADYPTTDIIGVVRPQNTSTVIGNNVWSYWSNKYLTDSYGAKITENIEVYTWTETTKQIGTKSVEDQDGNVTLVPDPDNITLETKSYSYEADRFPDGIKPPLNAVKTIRKRPKINPNYDPEIEYKPRSERPEWNIIALVGQVPISVSAVKNPNWRKMRDIDEHAEMWFIK